MIYVVEGPNAAGKTTFCNYLSRVLRIPLYVDLSRKIEGRSDEELQLQTPPFDLFAEQVGPNHDFVLDRFWPTTFVFKELNPERPPLPGHLACGPVERARRGRDFEVLIQVRTDVEILLDRLRSRGEVLRRNVVEAEVGLYDRLFESVRAAGIPVVVVDGSRGLEMERWR